MKIAAQCRGLFRIGAKPAAEIAASLTLTTRRGRGVRAFLRRGALRDGENASKCITTVDNAMTLG
jgi:hypothetical protein